MSRFLDPQADFEDAERRDDARREREASDGVHDDDADPEDCCPTCYTQTEEHQADCEYHAERLREDDADRRYEEMRERRYQ